MTYSSLKSTLTSRTAIFYILAFLPLLLVAYYFYFGGNSILGLMVSFYGFLILLLKRKELHWAFKASRPQLLAGLFIISVSFLVSYELILTRFSVSVLYGATAFFYALYIIGEFLVFFSIPDLRKSLSAVLLIAAGGFSFYLGEWLEFYMEPLVPYFVPIFVFVINALSIPATFQTPNEIILHTSGGRIPVLFEAGCMGIYSFLVFSTIVLVVMIEEPATKRTKVLWSIGGVAGTFAVNVLRVSLIALVIYYFGYERWGEVHSWIGYTMFLIWLVAFLVLFSNRAVIVNRLGLLKQRIGHRPTVEDKVTARSIASAPSTLD